MKFYPNERMGIFIDGANLYGTAKALQFDVDYKRMLEHFAKESVLASATYYTAVSSSEEFSPLRPMIDYLEYNGWRLVTKDAHEYTDGQGRKRYKGNMDIEMAVDMLEAAAHLNHFVLFSGDGDFAYLVDSLQRRGARVTVVSSIKTTPPMCSDDLRRQADTFLELETMKKFFARERPVNGR